MLKIRVTFDTGESVVLDRTYEQARAIAQLTRAEVVIIGLSDSGLNRRLARTEQRIPNTHSVGGTYGGQPAKGGHAVPRSGPVGIGRIGQS
jgi:hypothetical protein